VAGSVLAKNLDPMIGEVRQTTAKEAGNYSAATARARTFDEKTFPVVREGLSSRKNQERKQNETQAAQTLSVRVGRSKIPRPILLRQARVWCRSSSGRKKQSELGSLSTPCQSGNRSGAVNTDSS